MFPLEQEGAGLLAASFAAGQLGLREGVLVSRSGGLGRLRPITRRSRRCSNDAGAFSDWRGRSDGNAAWRKTVGSLASRFHAALTLQNEIGPGLDRTTASRGPLADSL